MIMMMVLYLKIELSNGNNMSKPIFFLLMCIGKRITIQQEVKVESFLKMAKISNTFSSIVQFLTKSDTWESCFWMMLRPWYKWIVVLVINLHNFFQQLRKLVECLAPVYLCCPPHKWPKIYCIISKTAIRKICMLSSLAKIDKRFATFLLRYRFIS